MLLRIVPDGLVLATKRVVIYEYTCPGYDPGRSYNRGKIMICICPGSYQTKFQKVCLFWLVPGDLLFNLG